MFSSDRPAKTGLYRVTRQRISAYRHSTPTENAVNQQVGTTDIKDLRDILRVMGIINAKSRSKT